MLYIILLLILAVLLFGSSVVLGALGWILGFIVAVIALSWASITFGISTETWILGGIALVVAIGIAHYALQAKQKSDEEQARKDAGNPLLGTASISKRKEYERLIAAGQNARAFSETSQTYKDAYASIQFRNRVRQEAYDDWDEDDEPSTAVSEAAVRHTFSTYSRAIPPEIAGRKYVRNHTEVAGLHFRREQAMRYIAGAVSADLRGCPHGLNLFRESDNTHDKNAIQVFGWWGEQSEMLGYVPKEYAAHYAKIADRGGELVAVPKQAYQRDDGFVDVRFVIYGVEPA